MSSFTRIFTLSLIALAMFWATPSLFGQKLKQEDIPDDVIQTLDFEQSGAKVTQWLLEDGVYQATFKNSGVVGTIFIQQDGTFLETQYSVPKNSLPTAIIDYIETNYPLFVIKVSQTREAPSVSMYYHVEVRPDQVGAENSILTFDDMGRLLTRTDPEKHKTMQHFVVVRVKSLHQKRENLRKENPPKQSPLRNPLQHQSQLLRNQNDPLSRNRNWRFLLLMPTSWHLPKFQVQ